MESTASLLATTVQRSKGRLNSMNDVVAQLSHLRGRELLEPLIREYYRNRIALVSSFGAESAVLLHMVSTIDVNVPVVFIDTGKHFVETKIYRQTLIKRLGLRDVRTVRPLAADIARLDSTGELHKVDADSCCHIRKSLPLETALGDFDAWISGRKRFHGGERSHLAVMERHEGRLKVEPLAMFSPDDLAEYMWLYELPQHPLVSMGYSSIGCAPCTAKTSPLDSPRAGRWAGKPKTECGIHWTANGRLIHITRPGPLPASGC